MKRQSKKINSDSLKNNHLFIIKKLIKEVIDEEETEVKNSPPDAPQSLIKKLQSLLLTTNKIFDYAIIFYNSSTIGDHSGFDFEFFNSIDDVDYDSLEGAPICKVYKDKVEPINKK